MQTMVPAYAPSSFYRACMTCVEVAVGQRAENVLYPLIQVTARIPANGMSVTVKDEPIALNRLVFLGGCHLLSLLVWPIAQIIHDATAFRSLASTHLVISSYGDGNGTGPARC